MRGWMFAILRNQYTKILRTETKATPTHEHLDQFVDGSAGINKEADETVDSVQQALSTLEDKHKMPLLLVTMEGMTVDEAAAVLDVPRGTVLSRLHRGREKMKQILVRNENKHGF